MMRQSNYDLAQTLALEAGQLGVQFHAGEATPSRVMADITKARGNPKGLLASGRQALERGDYDLAESLAHPAEKAGSSWTFHFWGDSPSSLLKEVSEGRAKMATLPSKPDERLKSELL